MISITYNDLTSAMSPRPRGAAPLANLLTEPMRGSASIRMARIARLLEAEYQIFREQHIELIKKHGGENEDGVYQVPPDNQEEFNVEYVEILAIEIEINADPLPLSVLDGMTIKPIDIAPLDFLFEGGE